MNKFFLIGFMGAGKSTLGREAAETVGMPFIDLDDYVVVRERRSIAELFATEGEAVFREKERAALVALARHPASMIIACGGGTPCYADNMDLLRSFGTTLYLQQKPETLVQRLAPERAIRPLISHLSEEELLPFIQQLLAQRAPYYEQATHILPDPELSDLLALLQT